MKRILYSTALFVSLSLTGCQGFLDETPPSALVGDEAFSNPTMVYLNSVAQLYTALGVHGGFEDDYQGNNGLLDPFAEFSSDLIICPGRQGDWVDGGDYQNLFFQQYTPSYKMARASWNKLFNFIAKANKAIDDLEAIYERSEGESDYLLDYIYEIRALRAFYYLKAVDYFARVPIITSSEMSVSSVKQSDRSEVFNFVKTELEEIIPHLPEAKCQSMDTEYYGRVTKYVGYMLLAKLAINSPIYNDDNWNDGEYIASETEKFPGLPIYDAKILKEGRFDYNLQGVFDKISEAGKQIMFKCPDGTERNAWETVIICQEELNKAGYILNPVFADNFTNDGNENSPENIFIRPSDYSTYKLNDSFPAYTYAYEHGSTWGMAVYQAVGGPSGSLQAMYLFQYDPETDSSPDPRFDATYLHGYCLDPAGNRIKSVVAPDYEEYAMYLPMEVRVDFGADYNDSRGKYIVRWAGARNGKYKWDTKGPGGTFAADRVVYRYADALLLSAEAELRLGNSGEALNKLNQVRARAGVPELETITPQDIIDERGREFAWETTRREDLIRFGLYTLPTIDKFVGVPKNDLAKEFTVDRKGYRTVFPIPFDVLQLNQNLSQNPGW